MLYRDTFFFWETTMGKRQTRRLRHGEPSEGERDLDKLLRRSTKGQDISHLIHYDSSPRVTNPSQNNDQRHHRNRRRPKQTHFTSHLHLEGMTYINANYSFILKRDGHFNSQLLDPSIPPNENEIIRVLVNNGDYHCPICLGDEFVAPRMTKCGHIFCYPCILSLFEAIRNDPKALKNNPSLKHTLSVPCPLCSNIIKEKHTLLPVLIDPREAVLKSPVGSNFHVPLTLMYKPHGAINATPMAKYLQEGTTFHGLAELPLDVTPMNWYKNEVCMYNRLILTTGNFEIDCLNHEKGNLKTQKLIDVETYGSDGVWFDKAIEKIDQIINSIPTNLSNSLKDMKLSSSTNTIPGFWPPESNAFYFYQYDLPNSKQTYIISNLDTRVIRYLYLGSATAELDLTPMGSQLPTLPLEIIATVENINGEFSQVTPETASKFKFLGHYPMGKDVSVLEIDWVETLGSTESLVGSDLYKKLQLRSKQTNDKNKYEEKERIRGDKLREREVQKSFSNERDEENVEQDFEIVTKKKGKSNKALETWGAQKPITSKPNTSTNDTKKFSKTVWGTYIPIVVDPEEEARMLQDQRETQMEIENAIREATEAAGKKGKKPRKIYLKL